MEMKYYNPSNHFRAPIPREPKPYKPPSYGKTEVLVPQSAEAVRGGKTERPMNDVLANGGYEGEPRPRDERVEVREKALPPVNQPKAPPMNRDERLMIGLLLLLIMNGCEDYLLLLVLGYLVTEFHREK